MNSWRWRSTAAIALLSFLCTVSARTIDVPTTPSPDGKATVVNLSAEHSLELLQHWLDQAFSGLFATLATKKLNGLPKSTTNNHEKCAKGAYTVPDHARCLVQLMDHEDTRGKRTSKRKKSHGGRWYNKRDFVHHKPSPTAIVTSEMDSDWVGSFKLRAKREVVTRDSYTLSDNKASPLGLLAKQLTKAVQTFKNKTSEAKNWKTVISELKEMSSEMKAQKQMQRLFSKRFAAEQERVSKGGFDPRRPLAMKDYDNLDEDEPKALLREAREMEKRLPMKDRLLQEPINLIRQAAKIGMMMGGRNVSNFDEKALKLFSPRIMSVVPEEEDMSLLSPSLFSLHNEGKGVEKAASASNLLNGFGLVKKRDHDEWLNFVMEAAGVSDAVEKFKEKQQMRNMTIGARYEKEKFKTKDGQPLYFVKSNVTKLYGEKETKKIDVFEQLHSTYSVRQMDEMKKRGYAVLTPEQMHLMYGKDSPYNSTERLRTFTSLNASQVPSLVERDVRAIAELESFKLRQKTVVLTPGIFLPLIFASPLLSGGVILSPLLLSVVVLSPAVLGPLILSPLAFVPIILSPRVLSPLILNPLIFSPLILTPVALHPFILSPGVFNPFILSPFVLSPFILSPQVYTPIILSPFALSPIIDTPGVGLPLILSPFYLSPIIRSDQWQFALILSPYAYSPVIDTDTHNATVFASPSFMSK